MLSFQFELYIKKESSVTVSQKCLIYHQCIIIKDPGKVIVFFKKKPIHFVCGLTVLLQYTAVLLWLCLCMCNMVYGCLEGLRGGSKPIGGVCTEVERGTCSILCVSSLLCLAEVHLWQLSKSQTPSPLNSLYPFLPIFLFCVCAQKIEGPLR